MPLLHAAAVDLAPENEQTNSLSPSSHHELAVETVAAGAESASFSARLAERSTRHARNVTWIVRDAEGSILLDATSTTAALPLAPGYYTVDVKLGAIAIREGFTVLEGSAVTLNFVLNAGAMRVLARLPGSGGDALESRAHIYALTGKQAGERLAESTVPGEVLTLPAGKYRIESRLGLGNAYAVVDVDVNAGKVSAVEINHNAGVARLAFTGSSLRPVTWEVLQGATVMITNLKGRDFSLVLQPGTYTAIATIGGQKTSARFDVIKGGQHQVDIGE